MDPTRLIVPIIIFLMLLAGALAPALLDALPHLRQHLRRRRPGPLAAGWVVGCALLAACLCTSLPLRALLLLIALLGAAGVRRAVTRLLIWGPALTGAGLLLVLPGCISVAQQIDADQHKLLSLEQQAHALQQQKQCQVPAVPAGSPAPKKPPLCDQLRDCVDHADDAIRVGNDVVQQLGASGQGSASAFNAQRDAAVAACRVAGVTAGPTTSKPPAPAPAAVPPPRPSAPAAPSPPAAPAPPAVPTPHSSLLEVLHGRA